MLRWQGRAKKGLPLLARPGPKKLGPLPLEELRQEIEQLVHRPKRSAGSGALYRRRQHAISRRDLAKLINRERQAAQRRRRRKMIRITWKEPNLAWGLDATEYGRDQAGRKLYLVVAKDLASSYLFEPLVTVDPNAKQIAAYLRGLFQRSGPPLLLKRDNGSLFNNRFVDEVLAEQCVIPLNSPPYYPPYNGGIENGIRELKGVLNVCLPPKPPAWAPDAIAPFANAVIHLRNCRPRRGLAGHTAAETYHHQTRSRFGKRERHATFGWIKRRSNATIQNMEKLNRRNIGAAWRRAVETWLRCQGLISLTVNGKVLPHLPRTLLS
jgi:hypothetical protein